MSNRFSEPARLQDCPLLCSLACSGASKSGHCGCSQHVPPQLRHKFLKLYSPKDFSGARPRAAYQIEGAWNEDGKGESVWDRFAHTPGKIRNGDTGDVACDSYHRWREDIALMRAMNLNSYRFSISWPRIQPTGSGAANAKGVDYYSRLVDALLEAHIRPLVTLYHWDLPQALEDAGGWPNRDTAARFADYVQLVAQALGRPRLRLDALQRTRGICGLGYLEGTHAPGRNSLLDFLRATHVVNLAQGEGFRALKALRPTRAWARLSACPLASPPPIPRKTSWRPIARTP